MDTAVALRDYVPLFQSIWWGAIALAVAVAYREEITRATKAIVTRLEKGAAVGLGPLQLGELHEEIHLVKTRINELADNVATLFLATMSPEMYTNLKKLSEPGGFGSYEKTAPLERELNHLRNIGYVRIKSISSVPRTGKNLSDYVELTEAGRKFIELSKENREGVTGSFPPPADADLPPR